MNGLNFNHICVVVVTIAAVLYNIRESVAVVQNDEDILQDSVAAVKPTHNVRHVRVSKNLASSPALSIMDSKLSPPSERRDDDSGNSEEISFSQKDEKPSSQSAPISSTTQSNRVHMRNHSSNSLEYDEKTTNSSSLQPSGDGVADSSESASASSKVVVRAVPDDKETVVVNANTDGAKLEERESSGSNLWIYSNAVCILLVVGVSIFLIFYPKVRADKRTVRRKPSQSSLEAAESASSAPTQSSHTTS